MRNFTHPIIVILKRIGLLSDTHGFLDPKVLEHFKDVDEVWHAGDVGSEDVIDQLEAFKPTRIVSGNIDGTEIRLRTSEHLFFQIEDRTVLMTHIAGKPGKYYRQGKELIDQYRPNLFICGHSHILLVQNDTNYNMLWLNPGACGYKGFHQIRTIMRFEINGSHIQNLEVIELGDRTSY